MNVIKVKPNADGKLIVRLYGTDTEIVVVETKTKKISEKKVAIDEEAEAEN